MNSDSRIKETIKKIKELSSDLDNLTEFKRRIILNDYIIGVINPRLKYNTSDDNVITLGQLKTDLYLEIEKEFIAILDNKINDNINELETYIK